MGEEKALLAVGNFRRDALERGEEHVWQGEPRNTLPFPLAAFTARHTSVSSSENPVYKLGVGYHR